MVMNDFVHQTQNKRGRMGLLQYNDFKPETLAAIPAPRQKIKLSSPAQNRQKTILSRVDLILHF